jgi:hypothetical protein
MYEFSHGLREAVFLFALMLRCMSPVLAHHDRYSAGTECRLSGYRGSPRWPGQVTSRQTTTRESERAATGGAREGA